MRTINARSLPWPLHPEAHHCAVMASNGYEGAPVSCPQQVTAAALLFFESSRQLWLAFFCEPHAKHVAGAEPLGPEEAAELEDRRDQHELAMRGVVFRRPQPISRGKPWRPDEAPERQSF